MSAIDLAVKILKLEEGFRPKAYYDTKNIPTIGYGLVIGKQYDKLPTTEMTKEQAAAKLWGLCEVNEKTLIGNPDLFKAYSKCNDVRKAVLLSMSYQLGIYGVLKFKAMLAAIAREDWNEAHDECLDSTAARLDAPARFHRNANMLRTGMLDKYYD